MWDDISEASLVQNTFKNMHPHPLRNIPLYIETPHKFIFQMGERFLKNLIFSKTFGPQQLIGTFEKCQSVIF